MTRLVLGIFRTLANFVAAPDCGEETDDHLLDDGCVGGIS